MTAQQDLIIEALLEASGSPSEAKRALQAYLDKAIKPRQATDASLPLGPVLLSTAGVKKTMANYAPLKHISE